MKTFKKLLIAISISALSITNVNAQAVPKPATPEPTLPDKSANQERYTYIDRPYKAANDIKYKQVPINKAKFVNYLKKIPKRTLIELGIAVGINALSNAVDYVLDPANNTIQPITKLRCEAGPPYNLSADTPDQLMDLIFAHPTFKRNHTNPQRDKFSYNPQVRTISYNGYSYGGCQLPKQQDTKQDVSLDDVADKTIQAAKNNNPKAVRVLQDYADNEIQLYPDVYPDKAPTPNPNPNPNPNPYELPNPEIKPTPNPNPNPEIKPNPNPNPEVKPTPNPNPNENNKTDPTIKDEKTPSELPSFCKWASKVCDFIDWTKERPELQDEDVPEKNTKVKLPQEFDKDYIKTNAQCPSDIVREINTGFAVNKLVFEMSPICDFVSTYIKPVIMFIAYLSALLTISNAFKVG